jgi:LacI family transcriptional regulator
VARVVTGEATVSEGLAVRVLAAIDELGYRRDLNASGLRRRDHRTETIGLLVDDPRRPFNGTMQQAVQEIAGERDCAVFVASVDHDAGRERDAVASLARRRVDGLLIMPSGPDHSYLGSQRRAGIAIVCLDRPPARLEADVVVVDNRVGAAVAVSHLAAQGHRRIAVLGGPRSAYVDRERCDGALDALRAQGADPGDAHVRVELTGAADAEAAATALLRGPGPPTALFTSRYAITTGAIRALHRLRLEHEVALVGFDDFPLADLLRPAVSVVAHDPVAMGRLAAEQLFRRIEGDRTAPRCQVVPTRLVPRGSGERPPPR